MNNFGVFINPYYVNREAILSLLASLFESWKVNFFCVKEQRELFPEFIKTAEKKIHLDCILSFGGDGTFLRAMQNSLAYDAPLLGVNLGKLGFLSDIGMREMEKSLDELIHNRYKIQKRMLLKVTLKREGKILFSDRALNDAVLYKGETPRLTEIKVYSNKQFVLDTRCDGVVVSSPTGSTAYSLSAGGPLLSPVMDAIIVAPLNPHILSVRPMVFAATDKLSFRIMESHADCVLQLDGRNAARLQEADEITVSSDSRKLEMIKLSNKTFYQILRTKLNMGRK